MLICPEALPDHSFYPVSCYGGFYMLLGDNQAQAGECDIVVDGQNKYLCTGDFIAGTLKDLLKISGMQQPQLFAELKTGTGHVGYTASRDNRGNRAWAAIGISSISRIHTRC